MRQSKHTNHADDVGSQPTELQVLPRREVERPHALLLRPKEAAASLGVGRTTLYELLRTGELPAVHIGRSVRIPTHALQAWVERHLSERKPAS
jgi:excisionase family DNA binding protein